MILIADRIRAMGEMLARRFEADGLHAKAVSDSSELLQKIAAGNVQGVILDPMLPGNAGFGALIRIRALAGASGAIPVLTLSTNDAPEGVEMAKRAGSSDYAVKGRETPTQLVLRIRRLIGIESTTPYYVSLRAELGDAPRLAHDLHLPGLKCHQCRDALALVLEGDPSSGGYALSGTFACRRCLKHAASRTMTQDTREVA